MCDLPEHPLPFLCWQHIIQLPDTAARCYFFLTFYCFISRMWASTICKTLPNIGDLTEAAILMVIWLFLQSSDYILESVWAKDWWMLNISPLAKLQGEKVTFFKLSGYYMARSLERRFNVWGKACSSKFPDLWQETSPKPFLETVHANLHKLKEIFPLLEDKSDSFTA